MKKKIVHFVHCVDTEGPLYESLKAKFERIEDIFNVKVSPSKKNLEKHLSIRIVGLRTPG